MKLLILGGTVFLGRHLTQAALERGHAVTLFNRGRHHPELFPEAEKLRGDRDGDLSALEGRRWDAVVDTCGYVPRVVRQSAQLLAGAAERYAFISSISVYAALDRPGIDETAALGTLQDETVEEITGETYGPLKALCEREVEAAFPGGALIIRPGLIVGPYDPTDRFTYWPLRVARGGGVLAPAGPEYRIQVIDARDLAQWTLHMLESGAAGVYNATGPDYPLALGRLLYACGEQSGSEARITWADEAFLLEQGVAPWSELPLWVPQSEPAMRCLHLMDIGKAVDSGLTFRPLEETVRDTLAWANTRGAEYELRAGLKPEREAQLLALWRARQP